MADNLPVSAIKDIKDKSVTLLSLSVVRRDGSISSFKSDKISDAIKKAFLAQTKIINKKWRIKIRFAASSYIRYYIMLLKFDWSAK